MKDLGAGFKYQEPTLTCLEKTGITHELISRIVKLIHEQSQDADREQ